MAKITYKPFKQNKRTIYTTRNGLPSDNVLSAAFDSSGRAWVGTDKGAAVLENGRFKAVEEFCDAVQVLFTDDKGTLWVGSGNVVCTSEGKNRQELDSEIVSISQDHSGNLRLITKNTLYRYDGEFVFWHSNDGEIPLDMCAFGDGEVYIAAGSSLKTAFGKRLRWFAINNETSDMPETQVQAVAADKFGMLWVGTEDGVLVYDSRNHWVSKKDVNSLCSYNIKKILFGKSGKRYVGTDIGIMIYDGAKRSFYIGGYWLPTGEVTALAENADGNTLLVGTPKGVSCIETVMMTLADKAKHYSDMTEKYNVRDIGFVTNRDLDDIYDFSTGGVEISDNDGLWTGSYLIGQAYRYAVTGEKESLDIARRSMKALLLLMKITGIPGFTARAIRRPGERGYGNGNPEWHPAKDDISELEWKGETSSDEMVGHFTASSCYFDFCATEEEKKEISDAICAIVDHILSHDYRLCDADGLPTTWANWNPDDLNRSDRWYWERGINSLEMLCFLKVAYHMSGDEKYNAEYLRLIKEEHYAVNTMSRKVDDAHTCHIDDNLGFLISIPLLRYETDPDILHCYLIGMREHWEYERAEHNPFWNILYGIFTDECSEIDVGVNSLREMPLDLMELKLMNSVRNDLVWDYSPEKYGEPPQLKESLPYDEKPLANYDCNQFLADRLSERKILLDASLYMMPYWMGRYYGLIGE
ncbi:MAG: hypothetical protein IKK37_03000 [Clostridia bacterium]|nr:hypothetical protein [Clostridia bacterium]